MTTCKAVSTPGVEESLKSSDEQITREIPSGRVLDDIQPGRSGLSESSACLAFGGSRDIQTDVYVDYGNRQAITRDVEERPEIASRDSASPNPRRSVAIGEHRTRAIQTANGQAEFERLENQGCSRRASRISFNSIVIAYDADDGDAVHGRMHAIPLVGSFQRSGALRRCSRVSAKPRRRVCVSHSGDILKVGIFGSQTAQCTNRFLSSGSRACTYRAARGGDQTIGLPTAWSPTTTSHRDVATVSECQHTDGRSPAMSPTAFWLKRLHLDCCQVL